MNLLSAFLTIALLIELDMTTLTTARPSRFHRRNRVSNGWGLGKAETLAFLSCRAQRESGLGRILRLRPFLLVATWAQMVRETFHENPVIWIFQKKKISLSLNLKLMPCRNWGRNRAGWSWRKRLHPSLTPLPSLTWPLNALLWEAHLQGCIGSRTGNQLTT